MHLSELIANIVNDLENKPTSDVGAVNVWQAILTEIAEQGSCNNMYIRIIENLIEMHLGKLTDQDKISVWKETEAGWEETDSIEFIEMNLEIELLDQITKYAWEESEKLKPNKKKKKKRRRSKT